MFNDEASDLNVLVASDAIGMGLNLNISRIIFSTLKKFDGICTRELTVPEIKQIAGIMFAFQLFYPCSFLFPYYTALLSCELSLFCMSYSFGRQSWEIWV